LFIIFAECGKITICFNAESETALKNINKVIDINNFKETTSSLESDDWVKVINVLSQENMIGDIFLKHLFEQNKGQVDLSFYSNCIKYLFQMLEKGQNADRMNFIFQKTEKGITEKLKTYEALLYYEMTEEWMSLLDNTEYVRDPKKKKALKLPSFVTENSVSKFMQRTPEHNILIYNKYGEFFFRNKMIENILKNIYARFDINDIECKKEFMKLNELYEDILKNVTCFNNSENIMIVNYKKIPEEKQQMEQME